MCTDFEPVLAFFVGFREEEGEAGEGRVGDCRGFCRWNRFGDWDGIENGAGWRQGRGIVGLD